MFDIGDIPSLVFATGQNRETGEQYYYMWYHPEDREIYVTNETWLGIAGYLPEGTKWSDSDAVEIAVNEIRTNGWPVDAVGE